MSERSIDAQLNKYLADVHSIEEQALTQLRRALHIAVDDRLAAVFERHLAETNGQEDRIRRRLDARDADPSTLKDLAGKAGGMGMIAFAKTNPDTPGKLTAHAFSYEHMEIAAYQLLRRAAERAGDADTVDVSHRNLEEEQEMAGRLADCFDAAVAASLRDVDPGDLDAQLDKYLVDAHALEQQASQLLTKGRELVSDDRLASVFQQHLEETRGHSRRIEEQLDARDAKPSRFQDGSMRGGAINLGAFFAAQPDTTPKLAGFAFAFEHLEIAAYELLKRAADRAAEQDLVDVADGILVEERAAAQRVAELWDHAIEAGLAEQGVAG